MTNNTVLTYTNRGVAYRITLNAETNLSRTNVLTSNIQLMIIQLISMTIWPILQHFYVEFKIQRSSFFNNYHMYVLPTMYTSQHWDAYLIQNY